MAKLSLNPITAQDLQDFVSNNSDFAFEMNVLHWFRNNGFSCQHSATYRDPVTNKLRQFDIRAEVTSGTHTLALAVECKNFRPSFPLLISTLPRTEAEAFHSFIHFRSKPSNSFDAVAVNPSTVYKPNHAVGKTTDQVGRDDHSKQLVSNDEQAFDKISQAINVCRDFVDRFASEVSSVAKRIIVPVLVVPSGMLWQVHYDTMGQISVQPRQVNHLNLFLNSPWEAKSPYGDQFTYQISHLEIVAFDGLGDAVDFWTSPNGFFS